MTTPEEALTRARRAAAEARGDEAVVEEPALGPGEAGRIAEWRLTEWAIVEPDPAKVYSTRLLGTPITWIKRGLLRAMRQYHGQILAQQSRFNAHVAAHLLSLDNRVSALEAAAAAQRREDTQRAPSE
jgi:hypothetical protein